MVALACRRPPSKTASFLAATVPASKPASSPASAAAAFRKKSPSAKIFPRAASAFAAAINTPKAPASKSPSLSLPAPAPSSSPSASSFPNPSPPPASTATAPPTSSPPSTLNPLLVQFGSHRGLQGSHIGGHIVYIYNVSASALAGAVASVWEDSDEEMGPLTGFVSRRVSREGRQSAVGGLHRSASDSVGTVAQESSPTRCDRAH